MTSRNPTGLPRGLGRRLNQWLADHPSEAQEIAWWLAQVARPPGPGEPASVGQRLIRVMLPPTPRNEDLVNIPQRARKTALAQVAIDASVLASNLMQRVNGWEATPKGREQRRARCSGRDRFSRRDDRDWRLG
jgi:hypothetical protein